MMNVNENNELKTAETSVLKGAIAPIDTFGVSFKAEFEKLLTDDNPQDISIAAAAAAAVPAAIQYDTLQYDTKTIDNVDAMFFLNISNASDTMNLQLNSDTSVIDASNYKTMEVSKTLGDMMVKASESSKALRLDFDNQVTVVLKVSKEGRIDASFIPQNKEVETYLKNNIDYLKVRFDEQNIAYSNISYKPFKQGSRNNKQGEKQ